MTRREIIGLDWHPGKGPIYADDYTMVPKNLLGPVSEVIETQDWETNGNVDTVTYHRYLTDG